MKKLTKRNANIYVFDTRHDLNLSNKLREHDKLKIIELIKQRKWVWNEEKFGSVKNHKMFDMFVEELLKEVNLLNKTKQ